MLSVDTLDEARRRVAKIVGRDTHNLSPSEVMRATVETVAENSIDGVVAPLFYALVGGAPLALASKAVNTLDSMVGHKNERYLELGRCAAKLDDAANYIPARTGDVLIPLVVFTAPRIKVKFYLFSGIHGRCNPTRSPNDAADGGEGQAWPLAFLEHSFRLLIQSFLIRISIMS